MDELTAAFRRQVRFESGTVEQVDDQAGYQVRTGDREFPRTGLGRVLPDQFSAGSRVLTVDGQILGLNPWITE